MAKSKILIVDDLQEFYDGIRPVIERYNVNYSNDVEDAIMKIGEGDYRVVITAYDLGDESHDGGLRVIKTARDKGVLLPILTSMEDHRKEAWDAKSMFICKKGLIGCLATIIESNSNGK